MKKTILLLAIICLACLSFTSCEKSPDIPVVGKPSTDPSEGLPLYTVLSRVNRIDGSGVDGSVLVKRFSTDTPMDTREKTLRSIKRIEGFGPVSLYCTEDAYKANFSSSFLTEHPDALETGYLGMLNKSGTFIPPTK